MNLRPRPFVFLPCAPVLALAAASLAQGNGPWTQVCNQTNGGAWAGVAASTCDVSHDGRFVAFVTSAPLDPADLNWPDVYVRDLEGGLVFAASRGQGGVWGDHAAERPALSATGRYVAFQSQATNLVPGNDPGFDPDIFVRDTQSGTTQRCSIGPGGVEPNGICVEPDISGDGRYVSFVSPATNLLPNPGAYRQVFVCDRVTGTLRIASSDSSGVAGIGHSYQYRSALSGDGRYCVFDTFASFSPFDTNGTVDVYRKDLSTGQIALVSADPLSGQASPGSYGYFPSLSADGRYVAFATGSGYAANDTNFAFDVYVRDMTGSVMALMSVGLSGLAVTGGAAEISADGRHVAFTSAASTLVPNDTNNVDDVFVRDWTIGQTTRESVSYAGGDANGPSSEPNISGNGRRLAFLSSGNNLALGFAFAGNCYGRDRGPSPTPQVYCAAKLNSLGCTPSIGYTGAPSATFANNFHITAANVLNNKNGTLFYSVVGPAQLPFQGGWLCVRMPRRAPGVLFSGGSPSGSDCTGVFDRDFNSYIASGLDPALVPGQEFWTQFWSRDPADPFTTNLTDALDAVVGP